MKRTMSDLDIYDFGFVWKKWVIPAIDKISKQMDSDFKSFVNFSVRDLDEIEKSAGEYFIKKREATQKEYYGDDPAVVSKKHLMDFHKLSAILCRTLVEHKVYYYDVQKCSEYIKVRNIDSKNTDWLVRNVLVNFRLAFYASVIFLYQSMLYKFEKSNCGLYELLRNQKKLNLYTLDSNANNITYGQQDSTHESFENSLVLDLAKRDINNRSFDCFMYSTIMFQLEEYNKLLLANHSKE